MEQEAAADFEVAPEKSDDESLAQASPINPIKKRLFQENAVAETSEPMSTTFKVKNVLAENLLVEP